MDCFGSVVVFLTIIDEYLFSPCHHGAQAKAVTDIFTAAILVTHENIVVIGALLAILLYLDVEEQRLVPVVE